MNRIGSDGTGRDGMKRVLIATVHTWESERGICLISFFLSSVVPSGQEHPPCPTIEGPPSSPADIGLYLLLPLWRTSQTQTQIRTLDLHGSQTNIFLQPQIYPHPYPSLSQSAGGLISLPTPLEHRLISLISVSTLRYNAIHMYCLVASRSLRGCSHSAYQLLHVHIEDILVILLHQVDHLGAVPNALPEGDGRDGRV